MGKPKAPGERTPSSVLLRLSDEQRSAIDRIASKTSGPLNIPVARTAIVMALLDLGIQAAQQGGDSDG